MSIEIEAKMKVDTLEPYRVALPGLGALLKAELHQRDSFFDRPDRQLLHSDSGLRLREATGPEGTVALLCFKGPRQAGPLKRRVELEFTVGDAAKARAFVEALGFAPMMTVEKHRQLWGLAGCEVCLDEVAGLGTFVEIEGPDEASIEALRQKLGLANAPVIQESYARLLAAKRS